MRLFWKIYDKYPRMTYVVLVVLASVIIFGVVYVVVYVLDLPQKGSAWGGGRCLKDIMEDVSRIREILEKWDALSAEGLGSGNLAPE